MKSSFQGFYPPTKDQYKILWDDALIVLDTNVLLNLYRLPTVARNDLLGVLKLLEKRLWIPHQVALEFQRRRLTVIASERKVTEDALKAASDLVSEIKAKVNGLQIDKRGLGIESQPLLSGLENANSKLLEAIEATHKSQLDISASDSLRESLDSLLDGKVGKGPTSQEELDELVAKADERYEDSIPPGFADIDKDKNPNEASFIFDHLKYQRKYGDLILWRQLINYSKLSKVKAVLLITDDRKEDWWWREQGKTVGPHPELVREIRRDGGVELFWMYTSAQFVEHANQYTKAKVSDESVEEIKQVGLVNAPYGGLGKYSNEDPNAVRNSDSAYLTKKYLFEWLYDNNQFVELNPRNFPEIIVRSEDETHGYSIKNIHYLKESEEFIIPFAAVSILIKGFAEMTKGRLTAFTLVVIVPAKAFLKSSESNLAHSKIYKRLEKLINTYPVSGIIVGVIFNERFKVLMHLKNPNSDIDDLI